MKISNCDGRISLTASAALRDVAHHIDLAVHFTIGFDNEAFVVDLYTVRAVTRRLEIISEASRRLPDHLKARHPSIAWKDMTGAGNIYRHDYQDFAAQHVWDAVQIDLPTLRLAAELQALLRRQNVLLRAEVEPALAPAVETAEAEARHGR